MPHRGMLGGRVAGFTPPLSARSRAPMNRDGLGLVGLGLPARLRRGDGALAPPAGSPSLWPGDGTCSLPSTGRGDGCGLGAALRGDGCALLC
jgi:hypothetical protein